MQIEFGIRKIKLLRIVVIVLLLNLASISLLINNHTAGISPFDNNSNSINLPLTSANEITLLTPENKTYTGPMSGYYPGTYGFGNELEGSSGSTIKYVDSASISSSCEVKIYDEFQGHNKVLRVHDGNSAGNAGAEHYFDQIQTTGEIEWWWLPYHSSGGIWKHFHQDQIGTVAFSISAANGEFFQNNGSSVKIYTTNQWYHHKITFDTNSDTYDWYIDDVMVVDDGAFENPVSNIGSTHIKGSWANTGDSYFDAFGYSWEADYSVGNNRKQGLLLSYDSSITLDSVKYSIDGLSSKTILGNTSINFPEDGYHNIQIFGNDSLGDWYESGVRYFTSISPSINIITPENKTYTEPMSGYYPGTYGFENELEGSSGSTIKYVDSASISSSCEVKIYDEFQGHNKVLRVHDGNSAGNAGAEHYFDQIQTTGEIEWWWLPYHSSGGIWKHFHQDQIGTVAFSISAANGEFFQNNGSSVKIYTTNQWYHHKITFDTNSDTYDWYIDDVMVVDDGAFENPVSNIGSTHIKGSWANTGDSYFDAFGYSWEADYSVGNNRKQGLLLSYDSSITLDSVKYSIDGLSSKTILGNTSINFPEDGYHNIQIFGNDSLGDWYESEVRNFSVDALGPSITINSPTLNDIFNTISPNYDVMIIDFNLDKMWYSLDNGITNLTITELTGTIDEDEWNKQVDGSVTLRFFANDSFGHVTYLDILIEKDTTNPLITINAPLLNDFYSSTAPDFSLSISELNLNTTWYTLDNGLTNTSFTGLTGTIIQAEWNKKSDDAVQIRFYANDSVGNEDSEVITINKDTLNPEISITLPTYGAEFTILPPAYEITITEINTDSVWYTIDGGITTFPITGVSGSIDSTAWNNAPIGAVTIRYYVSDEAGNVNYEEVIVIKSAPPTEPPPGIPGYHLGILGLVLVGALLSKIILIKRKTK